MKSITRRKFLGSLAGGAAAAAAAGCRVQPAGAAQRESNRKPNIVWMMADDLAINHVGFTGQKLITTPHIDRIAAEGRRFSQAYAGHCVCAPSRSCLMTGLHTGHTTVRNNSAPGPGGGAVKAEGGWRLPLQDADVTVAEVLKGAGYATGIFGKWGLGENESPGQPNQQGFDEWFGYLNQNRAHEYYTEYLWRNQEKVFLEGNKKEPKTDYSHDLIHKESLRFLERNKDKPFFLYLAYTIPHAKLQAPDLGEYADKDWPKDQKIYAAMVSRLDRSIGEVMARLKEYGIDENTIVFFTSDNGSAVSGGDWERFEGLGPFRGKKGGLYEGGLRVPMAVRWPGRIEAGGTSDHVWAFWDFLPTAAELAGVARPAKIDGISIVPALTGQKQTAHEFLYWEIPGGLKQAVRMGDWKAYRPGKGKPLELYNLKTDIGEENNVADQHPDVVARIEVYLQTARTESPYYPTGKKK